MSNHHPIYFVHGVLGWGPQEKGFGQYWGEAHSVKDEKYPQQKGAKKVDCPIKFASVGPVSSHWDRARELFYQIKGGDCDYGENHAEEHHHKQELEDWEKANRADLQYRDWDEEHPVHLVGHSQGAVTIRLLEWMLDNQRFSGFKTSAKWIKSVTSISGVLNGSTLPYASLGADPETGLLRKLPLFASGPFLGLSTGLHAVSQMDQAWSILWKSLNLESGYNWDLDQWELKRRNYILFGEPFWVFFWRILNHDFLYSEDNAAYSLSVHGTVKLNERLKTYKDTYYFSYVTQQTQKAEHHGYHVPHQNMLFLMKKFAWEMGRFDKSLAGVEGFNPKDWWANDGAVPVISQTYPFLPLKDAHKHPHTEISSDWPKDDPIKKGQWYVMKEPFNEWDHLDVVMFHENESRRNSQYCFYENLIRKLWELPD